MIKKLDILFEDKWFIAIDKPSGLLSVGAPGRREITAYSLVEDYLYEKYRGRTRAYVLHRIDQFTSGILLFAKERKMQEYMREYWNEIIDERLYVAVLDGIPQEKEGRIESWLTEDQRYFTVYSSLNDNGGLYSVSDYRVMSENAADKGRRARSLVEFSLKTGRKNQIRVHAATHLHCPVLGDRKYGLEQANKNVKRLCLHHKGLSFVHPATGEAVRIRSKYPRYFKELCGGKDSAGQL